MHGSASGRAPSRAPWKGTSCGSSAPARSRRIVSSRCRGSRASTGRCSTRHERLRPDRRPRPRPRPGRRFRRGDLTSFPIKQGGLAAQQADAAAEAIAAAAGAEITDPVHAGPPRDLAHRPHAALHALRGRHPRDRARHRGALVAAGEDRRPLPRAVPRRSAARLVTPPGADAVEVEVEVDRGPSGDWARSEPCSVESRAAKPRRH